MDNDITGGMGQLADQTALKVNEMLKDQEIQVLRNSGFDFNKLRPQISDEESYNKLISAVQIATQKNESIAEFKSRIFDLGGGVMKVAKEVIAIAR
jgi:hypothetical protein